MKHKTNPGTIILHGRTLLSSQASILRHWPWPHRRHVLHCASLTYIEEELHRASLTYALLCPSFLGFPETSCRFFSRLLDARTSRCWCVLCLGLWIPVLFHSVWKYCSAAHKEAWLASRKHCQILVSSFPNQPKRWGSWACLASQPATTGHRVLNPPFSLSTVQRGHFIFLL